MRAKPLIRTLWRFELNLNHDCVGSAIRDAAVKSRRVVLKVGEFMSMIEYSRKLGFRGIRVGRNIFQGANIRNCVRAINPAFTENSRAMR
jgi:hypothetical protein